MPRGVSNNPEETSRRKSVSRKKFHREHPGFQKEINSRPEVKAKRNASVRRFHQEHPGFMKKFHREHPEINKEIANRPEVKAKKRASMLGKYTGPKSEEHKAKLRIVVKEVNNRPEVKMKNSSDRKKNWQDSEYREKQRKSRKIAQNRPEVKERSRETAIEQWQDPKFIAKQIKARHAFPNKLEKFLDSLLQKLFLNQWEYVGSGDFIVEGTRRNPDFVHVSQKKIIEVFGDWWHGEEKTGVPNEQHEQERVKCFVEQGYQTLVIWEHELKDVGKLIEKILKFSNEE